MLLRLKSHVSQTYMFNLCCSFQLKSDLTNLAFVDLVSKTLLVKILVKGFYHNGLRDLNHAFVNLLGDIYKSSKPETKFWKTVFIYKDWKKNMLNKRYNTIYKMFC